MLSLLLRLLDLSDSGISIVGMAAAVLTTTSFLPQIFRAYRTKKMQDVSPYLMTTFMTGTVLWLAYGLYRSDLVIVAANAVATGFNAILLFMKFAYGRTDSSRI
jgi:MtN3 and saliva related transmembrane protein